MRRRAGWLALLMMLSDLSLVLGCSGGTVTAFPAPHRIHPKGGVAACACETLVHSCDRCRAATAPTPVRLGLLVGQCEIFVFWSLLKIFFTKRSMPKRLLKIDHFYVS